MKRQKILLISLLVLFAVLLLAYFFIIRPVTTESEEVKEPPVLEDGEALGATDRYFMFGAIEKSDIEKIIVENKYGGFSFVSKGGSFIIEGYEHINYDPELFASLVATSTYTLAKTKVGTDLSDEKLDEYGLLTPQASWVVTDKSGGYFRVFVGDRLLTGGGYYCMFEGRRSVYVLDNTIEDTVLVPVENYVTPIICAGLSSDDYFYTDNFTVYKDDEALFRIRIQDDDKKINPEAIVEYIMDYPTSYYPNSSLYTELLYKYMNLTGDYCYKLGATDEDFAEVGLDSPAHMISFDYRNSTVVMLFSELQPDGTYYAASNIYPGVISVCNGEDFAYLEYDLIKWVDSYVFQQYITNIDTVSIKTQTVSADFEIDHSKDESGNALISVTANGKRLSATGADNFRQYYKSLLALSVKDYYQNDEYCTMTDSEMKEFIANPENIYLTFSYTTLAGDTETYSLYRYSTRHSLITVNGVGEFYVLTDLVKKIENDTQRILSGEEVVAYDKN